MRVAVAPDGATQREARYTVVTSKPYLFAADGGPVLLSGIEGVEDAASSPMTLSLPEITTSGRTLTLTRRHGTQTSSTEWDLPVRFPRANPWGVFGDQDVAFIQPTNVNRRRAIVWVFDKHTGQAQARLSVPADPSIEGWTDSGALVMQIGNRRLITWNPQTGRFRRLLEFPAPDPQTSGGPAATVSLRSP